MTRRFFFNAGCPYTCICIWAEDKHYLVHAISFIRLLIWYCPYLSAADFESTESGIVSHLNRYYNFITDKSLIKISYLPDLPTKLFMVNKVQPLAASLSTRLASQSLSKKPARTHLCLFMELTYRLQARCLFLFFCRLHSVVGSVGHPPVRKRAPKYAERNVIMYSGRDRNIRRDQQLRTRPVMFKILFL